MINPGYILLSTDCFLRDILFNAAQDGGFEEVPVFFYCVISLIIQAICEGLTEIIPEAIHVSFFVDINISWLILACLCFDVDVSNHYIVVTHSWVNLCLLRLYYSSPGLLVNIRSRMLLPRVGSLTIWVRSFSVAISTSFKFI